jgi:DNA-binding transcriptional regulator YiaG
MELNLMEMKAEVGKTSIAIDDWIKESVEDEKEKLKLEKIKMFSTIASEIIKYRIDNNMSQSELAKKLGVTQNQVSK